MKKRLFLTVLFAACFSLFFQATPFLPKCLAKSISLDYELWLPSKIPIFPLIDNFFKGLEKATGGQVKVAYHTGGSMGKVTQTYDRTLSGVNDIGTFLPGFYPGVFPMVSLFDYPIYVPSSEKMTEAMLDLYDKGYFDKDFSKIKIIGLNNNGPAVLYTTDKKLTSLEDIKGLKIRISSEAMVPVMKAMGAVPVAVPTGEVYMMLQKKSLDGTSQIWDALPSYKLGEVCKYVNELYLTTLTFVMGMNRDSWESLPKEGKDYINANWKKLSLDISRHYDRSIPPLEQMFLKGGGEITKFPPGDYKKMDKLFVPIWDKFIASSEAKGLPMKKAVGDLEKVLSGLGVENAVLGYTP